MNIYIYKVVSNIILCLLKKKNFRALLFPRLCQASKAKSWKLNLDQPRRNVVESVSVFWRSQGMERPTMGDESWGWSIFNGYPLVKLT